MWFQVAPSFLRNLRRLNTSASNRNQDKYLVPHMFVWDSCFWFCTPGRLRLPPPRVTHNSLTHNLLTHNSLTHNLLTHNSLTHTTYSHTHTHNSLTYNSLTHNSLTDTTYSHNLLTHTQIIHAQLPHTQLSNTQLSNTQLIHTQLSNTQLTHTHNSLTQLTWRHRPSLCVAGLALVALGLLWWRAWVPFDAVVAAAVCVAGAALGDIGLHFAWQLWHLETSTFTLCGKLGTYGTELALVARLGPL